MAAQIIPMPRDEAAHRWRRAYRDAHPARGRCRWFQLERWQDAATRDRLAKAATIRKGVETRRRQRIVMQTEARVCVPFPDTRRMALRRKAWRDAIRIMEYIGGKKVTLGGPATISGPLLLRWWGKGKARKTLYEDFERLMPLHLAEDDEGVDPRHVLSERPFAFSLWTAVLLARAGCTWEELCVPYEPYTDHPIPWLVEVRELSIGDAIEHCRQWTPEACYARDRERNPGYMGMRQRPSDVG